MLLTSRGWGKYRYVCFTRRETIRRNAQSDMRKPLLGLQENERGMSEIKTPLTAHVKPASRMRPKVVSPVINSSVTVRSFSRVVVAVTLGGRQGARA